MSYYRSSVIVYATQLDEDQTIVTDTGPVRGNRGDYLVYSNGSTHIVDEATFTSGYELVDEPGLSTTSNASSTTVDDGSNGDTVFHPAGKTVDVVVGYMKSNPDEVSRIQDEEKKGASRSGITGYGN